VSGKCFGRKHGGTYSARGRAEQPARAARGHCELAAGGIEIFLLNPQPDACSVLQAASSQHGFAVQAFCILSWLPIGCGIRFRLTP
jgi:hypothetical protein